MESSYWFLIDNSKGAFLYELFYQLAFIIALIAIVFIGIKRNYPIVKWLLLTLFVRIIFIVGSKIGGCSTNDWSFFLTHLYFPVIFDKTLWSGLIAGIIGVFVVKKILHLKFPIFDIYALIIPLAIAIQRLGCLFYGCCFGKITDSPFAISYGQSSPVYHFHLHQGLITESSINSLHVFPVQLISVIASLLIFVFAITQRKRFKVNGSLALSVLALLALSRFVTEFLREPITNGLVSKTFLSLEILQWGCMITCITFFTIIYYREKYAVKLKPVVIIPDIIGIRDVSLLTLCIIILYTARNWFTAYELLAMNIIMIITAIAFFKHFIVIFNLKYKIAALSYISLLFIIISGFTYKDSVAVNDTFKTQVEKYIALNLGNGENYDEQVCGPTCKNEYKGVDLNYRMTYVTKPNRSYSIDYYGSYVNYNRFDIQEPDSLKNYNFTNFGFLGKINFKYVGFGIGFNVGGVVPNHFFTYNKNIMIIPSAYIRAGKLDLIYFEGGFFDRQFGLPGTQTINAGIGMSFLSKYQFKIGYSENGLYYNTEIDITKNWGLKTLLQVEINNSNGYNAKFFGVGTYFKFNE